MHRQVGHGAESAVALAEHAPGLALADELAADELGIAHDAVGAEMLEILGLRARVAATNKCLRQHYAAQPVAARVEEEHVVVVECPLEPAVTLDRSRPWKPGSTLQEDEPRPGLGRFFAVLHGARENRQRLARRCVVIERDGELILAELHPMVADGGERTDG